MAWRYLIGEMHCSFRACKRIIKENRVNHSEKMKYSITADTNPKSIPESAEELHLVRPVKRGFLESILNRCRIRKISLSKSCSKRLGAKTRKFMKEKGIEVIEQQNRGRALSLDLEKIKQVAEYHKDHLSFRKIEKLTGIPKSTIHYLIRYAERSKVKAGKQVVYL